MAEMEQLVDRLIAITPFNVVPVSACQADVAAAERELGVAFPDDFKRCLELLGNRYFRNWELYRVLPAELSPELRYELACCDIVRCNHDLHERWEVPDHLIAFYTNGLADYVCFDKGAKFSPVVIWLHDAEDAEEQIQPVARLFTEWLREEVEWREKEPGRVKV